MSPPGAPASSVARFFDAIAPRYDRVYARSREASSASVRRLLAELAPASQILDLGVGTGRELPALLDAGHLPVGLDTSSAMLALCGERARPIPLVQGDLWAGLPWPAASFDAVIALHGTLAHAPDEAALRVLPRDVGRVLRPGGLFLAEVPTSEWLAAAARGLAGTFGAEEAVSEGPFHGRFTDDVTRATVDVLLPSREEWIALLQPHFASVRVDPGEPGELVLVARVWPA